MKSYMDTVIELYGDGDDLPQSAVRPVPGAKDGRCNPCSETKGDQPCHSEAKTGDDQQKQEATDCTAATS